MCSLFCFCVNISLVFLLLRSENLALQPRVLALQVFSHFQALGECSGMPISLTPASLRPYPRLQSLSSKIPLPATWTGSQVPQLQLAVNLVGTQSMWNLFANCEVWYSQREQLCSLFLAWFFACCMFVLSFLCAHPSTLTESSKKSKVLCDSILACETNNSNTTQTKPGCREL